VPRLSIVTPDKATSSAAPPAITGNVATKAYICRQSDPVHLHMLELHDGAGFAMEPYSTDRNCFVWHGEVEAGGSVLPAGSSFIVEHGASLTITARAASATLLLFAENQPSRHRGEGGHVHLLPEDRVPRSPRNDGQISGVGLHSDTTCATCELWLQESFLPGMAAAPPPDSDHATSVHAHAEDEIIFVTRGQIRLGNKLFETGTALGIPADTLYSFSPGPESIEFLTFRPARPGGIRYGKDSKMTAPAHWGNFPSPDYLART